MIGLAVLITFSVRSGKFGSLYERNKFFRGLYGWKQIIRKEVFAGQKQRTREKVYSYRREGLLDEIPHEKVDQSSFIVPEEEVERVIKFFREWRDKVMWRCFKILLDDDMEDIFKNWVKERVDE